MDPVEMERSQAPEADIDHRGRNALTAQCFRHDDMLQIPAPAIVSSERAAGNASLVDRDDA